MPTYDKELCDERHERLKESSDKQETQIEKLHGRITGVYIMALGVAVTAIGGLIMFILARLWKE